MRIVKGKAKKGGKSHRKATAKNHLQAKTAAAHKLVENLLGQMKQMEIQALRYALKKYLGDAGVDIAKVKKHRFKDAYGYVLEYDGVKLGKIEKQHAVDPKATPNFRIVFTPFETPKLKVA